MKNFNLLITALFAFTLLFASCTKESLTIQDETLALKENTQNVSSDGNQYKLEGESDNPEAIEKMREGKIIASEYCNYFIQFNNGEIAEVTNFPNFVEDVTGASITVTYLPLLHTELCKSANMKVEMVEFYIHNYGNAGEGEF